MAAKQDPGDSCSDSPWWQTLALSPRTLIPGGPPKYDQARRNHLTRTMTYMGTTNPLAGVLLPVLVAIRLVGWNYCLWGPPEAFPVDPLAKTQLTPGTPKTKMMRIGSQGFDAVYPSHHLWDSLSPWGPPGGHPKYAQASGRLTMTYMGTASIHALTDGGCQSAL